MKLAVLSDIHGNGRALDAVLADVKRRGVQSIVNLGDCVYGPFDPRSVIQWLMESETPTVRGNEDRILTETTAADAPSRAATFCVDRLDGASVRWLAALPETLVIHGMLLVHGSPETDARSLLTAVTLAGIAKRSQQDLDRELSTVHAAAVLCGHDHIPNKARLSSGTWVINPGSVGCPAYVDDTPVPHEVENGSPHARYAMIETTGASLHVDFIEVSYDWEAAASEALHNGFPDWSRWLETGCV